MDLVDMMECLAIEPVNLGMWVKPLQQRSSQQPVPRQHHSTIIHKSSLYIYGGVPQQQAEDHLNEQRTIYRYNISSKGWSKSITNFLNNNSFSYIYAHSTIIFNNMMYLFGGKNYKNDTYVVGLWCLNLESFNWKRQELKGYSPSPRENASLVLHQRSMIVLYGGRYEGNNLNDLHIYRIENKVWIQIEETSYDLKISCRLKPALASQGDFLYLFGGERMIANEDKVTNHLLDDFYQLRFLYRPMSTKPDVWIKQIITNTKPAKKVGTFVNLNEKYLMLWGGDNYYNNKITSQPGFWIYNVQEVHWNWVKIKGNIDNIPRIGFTINYCNDKAFIFGQQTLNQAQLQKKTPSGMLILNLDIKQLDQKLNEGKFRPKISQSAFLNCNQCYEYHNSLTKNKFSDFIILKESLSDRIQFVYSAFGLLVDNSLTLKAKECRIVFHHNTKQKFCLIQDNGNTQNIWNNHQDFINDLTIFRTYVEENIDLLEQIKEEDISKRNIMKEENSNPAPPAASSPVPIISVPNNLPVVTSPTNPNNLANLKQTKEQKQQKQKQLREKQEEKELRRRKQQAKRANRKKIEDRKQFSRNIKLGSLRIGDRVLFINKYGSNNQNRRVFVIQKYESNKAHEYTYRTYYYIFENNSLIEPYMDVAKKYIDQQYKMYFKISNQRKQEGQNFVFITNLKQTYNDAGQIEPELKQSTKHGDVFCCQKRFIQNLEDGSFLQSIDLSLKSYLTLLYLKCDEMKISLTISDHKLMEINNLEFFQKIDNLVKSEKIIDLQQALDLSNCKIIEVYYNKSNNSRARDTNRKVNTNSFLNGVLLYQKNRLICRYKFPLGEVSRLFKNKIKNVQQTLMMFGFIEIKDEFSVNMFKTAFVRDDVLEEIYHRLKFVQLYAEKNTKDDTYTRPRPLDDKNDKNNEGKKKFKSNEDGKDEPQVNPANVIQID